MEETVKKELDEKDVFDGKKYRIRRVYYFKQGKIDRKNYELEISTKINEEHVPLSYFGAWEEKEAVETFIQLENV